MLQFYCNVAQCIFTMYFYLLLFLAIYGQEQCFIFCKVCFSYLFFSLNMSTKCIWSWLIISKLSVLFYIKWKCWSGILIRLWSIREQYLQYFIRSLDGDKLEPFMFWREFLAVTFLHDWKRHFSLFKSLFVCFLIIKKIYFSFTLLFTTGVCQLWN